MTTLVRTRQPLHVLSSMNNQPEQRRHSKRLAGGTLPLLPSRPVPSSQEFDSPPQPQPPARGGSAATTGGADNGEDEDSTGARDEEGVEEEVELGSCAIAGGGPGGAEG
ncbi:hypothetical protein N0V88_000967 [Collariella sp. IMI 366227]|nr:hypothetical protein N0V88_000967 [Collariella sp. IMI 366227]